VENIWKLHKNAEFVILMHVYILTRSFNPYRTNVENRVSS